MGYIYKLWYTKAICKRGRNVPHMKRLYDKVRCSLAGWRNVPLMLSGVVWTKSDADDIIYRRLFFMCAFRKLELFHQQSVTTGSVAILFPYGFLF